MTEERIPKIIHYCWFGGGEMPETIKMCMKTWEKLGSDYELKKQSEENCDFDENEFVKRAYKAKKWAFVSDYYRLKALYEYGGIYMDTDVRVFKKFDDLLKYPMFFGYIYNCVIGTAVIGAEPHNPIVKGILDLYDNIVFVEEPLEDPIVERDGKYCVNNFDTNNFYITWYIMQKYPELRLNNSRQDLGDFIIFPKEIFEIGSLLNRNYTIHECEGSWRKSSNVNGGGYNNLKKAIASSPIYEGFARKIVWKIRYNRAGKRSWFYKKINDNG